MEDWGAMKWDFQSLKTKIGDTLVHVRSNTNSQDYRVGKKYNIIQMKFSEYADGLINSTKRSKKLYLAVQNIKQNFPQLEGDLPLPIYIQYEKLHRGPFIWMAAEGHYEFCHIDPDDNFLCMIKGRKRVKLFDPSQLYRLYPNPLGSKGFTIQSQVDVSNPDLTKFPLFADAICKECILNPGEMLFIPVFYWHQVTSLDNSISVNVFYGDKGENNFLRKLLEPETGRWLCFSYWLLNIIEQNRKIGALESLLPVLEKALAGFLLQRFHEVLTEDMSPQLLKLVYDHCSYVSSEVPYTEGRKHPKLKVRGLLWRD